MTAFNKYCFRRPFSYILKVPLSLLTYILWIKQRSLWQRLTYHHHNLINFTTESAKVWQNDRLSHCRMILKYLRREESIKIDFSYDPSSHSVQRICELSELNWIDNAMPLFNFIVYLGQKLKRKEILAKIFLPNFGCSLTKLHLVVCNYHHRNCSLSGGTNTTRERTLISLNRLLDPLLWLLMNLRPDWTTTIWMCECVCMGIHAN